MNISLPTLVNKVKSKSLNCFLPSLQLIFVHLQPDSVLSYGLPFSFQVIPQQSEVILKSLLISLKEAYFFTVSLVPFSLCLELGSFSFEQIPVDLVSLILLVQSLILHGCLPILLFIVMFS
jgi:hypothetical protein